MARFNSFKTMEQAYCKNKPPQWQCENCGKIYPSFSKMVNTKCHSHPKGAWAGNCYCGKTAEIFGKNYAHTWNFKQQKTQMPCAEERHPVSNPSLYPDKNFIREVNIFDLSRRMLNEWNSSEAKVTRDNLNKSCHDYLWDMEEFHIFHKKYGINESCKDNLKSLQKKIDRPEFWMKLYCLLYSVVIGDEKYEHLLTEDGLLIKRWKSNGNWRWMSNWPNALVFRFVHCCIAVLQHDPDYSAEMHGMFDSIVEGLKFGALGVTGGWGSSKIPKEYGVAYKELAERDIHDIDFWFDFYCFLRLELKPGMAHLSCMEE